MIRWLATARWWRRRLLSVLALICVTLPSLAACDATSAISGSPAEGGASGGAATQAQPPPYDITPLLKPSHKYLGAALPGVPKSLEPLTVYAAKTGKRPNLVEYYASWGDGFDASGVRGIYQAGGLAYMAWEPFKPSIADIANGASDAYIKSFAKSVRTLNLPLAISFGHEMNGSWYPWGTQATKPADFIRAWRHIHDLFDQAGATNVIWVWSPNIINPVPAVKLQPYFPGNAYVDWIGVIGYYTLTGGSTFRNVFGPTMSQVRRFTDKPFVIAETSSELRQERAASVVDLFNGVTTHDDVLGFIWFDYVKRADWRIEATPLALAAFKRQASAPLFDFNVRNP